MEYNLKKKLFILILISSSSVCNIENDIINGRNRHNLLLNKSPNIMSVINELSNLYKHRQSQPNWSYDEKNSYEMYNDVDDSDADDDGDDSSDNEDYDANNNIDLDETQPYGVQSLRSDPFVRTARGKGGITRSEFQPLCPYKHEKVWLYDDTYQYRPHYYDEVYCLHPYVKHEDHNTLDNKVCGGLNFQCIQLNRTIYLTRRKHKNNCWETETRIVRAGCECMWPQHIFDDIAFHH